MHKRPQLCIAGRREYVPRWVVVAFKGGSLDDGLQACHHCDNPPCIRPKHLFHGTQSENIRDAMRKGRFYQQEKASRPEYRPRGENHPRSKITRDIALAIRHDRRVGRIIAKEYGISNSQVDKIRRGELWNDYVQLQKKAAGRTP